MARALGLHHMTVLDASHTELVSIAHEVGCQFVSLFVLVDVPGLPFDAITPAEVPEMLKRMDATGVTVARGEFFPITAGAGVDLWRPGIEIAVSLGAYQIVTMVHDTEQARATENLAKLCDLAAEYGLSVGLEFMGAGMMPGCASLAEARSAIERVGRPGLGIDIDCLHVVRTGATIQEIAELPGELVAYSQMCDGPDLGIRSDYFDETFERMVPGDGVFPVAEIIASIPPDTSIEVETPSLMAQRAGVPPIDRARRAVAACRTILNRAVPGTTAGDAP